MKRPSLIIVVNLLLLLLVLPNFSSADSVSGKVRYKGSDNPAPYALVIFMQDGRERARAITGDDGFYFIRNIAEGKYSVRIRRGETQREHEVQVGPNGGSFDFDL
jgi:hypothetical protein